MGGGSGARSDGASAGPWRDAAPLPDLLLPYDSRVPDHDPIVRPDMLIGPIIGFGDICNQGNTCKSGLTCLVEAQGQSGFCSKKCNHSGQKCTGGPTGTFPACVLPLQGGGNACVFICRTQGSTFKCPTELICGSSPNPPGSTQYICEVPGTATQDAGFGSGG